jgi:cytidylate kinase
MNRTFLNGVDVEDDIRGMNVSRQVSQVAAISEVRKAMVAIQKKMGQQKGIVMDGRDIGSVVFPEAELKIFLTADTDERVQRRLLEMLSKNMPADFNDIKANLISRDQIDSTRADSPLIKAADAVIIDNTHLSKTEQLALAMKLVAEKVGVGS